MMILLGSYTLSMGYFIGIFLDGAITNEMSSGIPVMAGTSQQEKNNMAGKPSILPSNFHRARGLKKGLNFAVEDDVFGILR